MYIYPYSCVPNKRLHPLIFLKKNHTTSHSLIRTPPPPPPPPRPASPSSPAYQVFYFVRVKRVNRKPLAGKNTC